MVYRKPSKNSPQKKYLFFEILMAIIAAGNLVLVLFNMTYIPYRDFYLRNFPQLTQRYDPVKGIEKHRDTENYIQVFNRLQKELNQDESIKTPRIQTTLEVLQRLSVEMIEENPFAVADKSGTLEKIKNRMRDHLNEKSAKQAFLNFWSPQYLSSQGYEEELNYFQKNIIPLINSNYWRGIGENGENIDWFWLLDLPFTILFALEFIARSYYIKNRHPAFSWTNAILWHWYDIFLFIPFWRWLRVMPVLFRLERTRLLNLQNFRRQIQQGIVANFAEEITQMVVIRVIDQTQGSIKKGDLTRWLTKQSDSRQYVDINNINEIEALAAIFVKAIVYQVIPKVKPEISELLQHNIEEALNQTPIYRNLNNLPGVAQMQNQLSEQLSARIIDNVYSAMVNAVQDPVSAELSGRLVKKFSDTLTVEMQQKQIMSEIQILLIDFLEEVKINYVQQLSQEDLEEVLEEAKRLKIQKKLPFGSDNNYPVLETKKLK
ncbi:MAG: hypothetical protein ACFB02_18195 [Mastigocoleus sp.]